MRIPVFAVLLLGVALRARGETLERKEEAATLMSCIYEDNTMSCLASRTARDIDEMELQVTGRKSEVPMSVVLERAGNLVAEVVEDLQNPDSSDDTDGAVQQEEGRRKKFGKKKKKHLQKLLGLIMLFKAKLSLLLQLISTHLQFKFFGIAVISLIINAARFWLDLKKSHPSKVIYYEHAQHQHHYDHDDHDTGYWGRSSDDGPQDLAYAAYASQH